MNIYVEMFLGTCLAIFLGGSLIYAAWDTVRHNRKMSAELDK